MYRILPLIWLSFFSSLIKAQSVTSITQTGTEIIEGGSEEVVLTAELDIASNQDITIPIEFSDHASDFEFDYSKKGHVETFASRPFSNLIDFHGIAANSIGELFMCLPEAHQIIKFNLDGSSEVFAGSGSSGSFDSVNPLVASFNYPIDIEFDTRDNAYITDSYNHIIRKISVTGEVSTFAGTPKNGSSVIVDGLGSEAVFSYPKGITIDQFDNLYITDNYNKIRKITSERVVTTFLSNDQVSIDEIGGIAYHEKFGFYTVSLMNWQVINLSIDGDIIDTYQVSRARDIEVDLSGNVFITNESKIQKIVNKNLNDVAGNEDERGYTDGSPENAQFYDLYGITIDKSGDFVVVDINNSDSQLRIRKINNSPQIIIPANQSTGSITFMAVDDEVVTEPDELVQVTVGDPSNSAYGFTPSSSYDFTIVDNDVTQPILSFEFSRTSLKESDTESIEFRAIQNAVSGVDTEITFTLSGLAEQNIDYSLSANSLIIPKGDTTATVSFTVMDDDIVEIIENITVAISVINATYEGESLSLELIDNDQPTITSLALDGSTITEGDGSSINLTATLDAASSFDVSVPIEFSGHFNDFEYNYDRKGHVETFASRPFSNLIDFHGIAANSIGELFMCLSEAHQIIKFNLDGSSEVFAGSGSSGSFDSSNPLEASFNYPIDIEFDTRDNAYITDSYNHIIRKISVTGEVSTFAGTPKNGSSVIVDGLGSEAVFSYPKGITIDQFDNLYVTDNYNKIRKITSERVVTTFLSNDQVSIDEIGGIAYHEKFGFYTVSLMNWQVINLSIDGDIIDTYQVSRARDIEVDLSGNVFITNESKIQKIVNKNLNDVAGNEDERGYTDGSPENAQFYDLYGITIDKSGDFVVVDINNSDSQLRIRKINNSPQIIIPANQSTGSITFMAVDDEVVTEPDELVQVTVGDPSNSAYGFTPSSSYDFTIVDNDVTQPILSFEFSRTSLKESDTESIEFRAIQNAVSGVDTEITFTLSGLAEQNIDYSLSANSLIIPKGDTTATVSFTVMDDDIVEIIENITVAISVINATYEGESLSLELIDNDQPTITSLALDGSTITEGDGSSINLTATLDAASSFDVSVPISFSENETDFTYDFDDYLNVTTLTGGANSSRLDGSLADARFQNPHDVLVAEDGTIYVSESYYIRKITTDGLVSTLAGGGCCSLTDGTGAEARFYSIRGMAFDLEGNIIVADEFNDAIRKVTTDGVVTTISGGTQGYKDGNVSEAQFYRPQDISVDSEGSIYVADSYNYRIRKIDVTGNVSTIAGTGSRAYREGSIGTSSIGFVFSLFVDDNDHITFGDNDYKRIRQISPEGLTTTIYGNGSSFGEQDGIGSVYQIIKGKNEAIFYYDGNSYTVRKIDSNGLVTSLIGDGQSGFENGIGIETRIGGVQGMTFDNKGNLLFTHNTDNNYLIREVSLAPQINIPANQSNGSITFTAVDDEVVTEPDELVQVTVGDPSNSAYGFTPSSSYDFTVVDNDNDEPLVVFELSRPTLREDATDSVFLYAKTNVPSGVDIQVDLSIAGDAILDADYTISSESIIIYAGDTSGFVIIKAIQDEDVEDVEPIVFNIAEIINATTESDNLVLELVDEDEPNVVSIEQLGTQVVEGGVDSVKLVATIDFPSSDDVSIELDLGEEYLSDFSYNSFVLNQTPFINIPSGQTTGEISFFAIDDTESNESGEIVTISISKVINAVNTSGAISFTFDIIDDEFGFTELDNSIPGLNNASIAWADYDRDGDKDVAIMGSSNLEGRVTRIYRNENGQFVNANQNLIRMADGNLAWVDVNNDGYVDLVTTGLSSSGTEFIIYLNENGLSFVPNTDHGIEAVGEPIMEWADFDNDGLKDLVLSGVNNDNQLLMTLYNNVDGLGDFQVDNDFFEEGVLYGDIISFDLDRDGDNDLIYSGEDLNDQGLENIRLNSLVDSIQSAVTWEAWQLKNASMELLNIGDSAVHVYMSGQDFNNQPIFRAYTFYSPDNFGGGVKELWRTEVSSIQNTIGKVSELQNGDIALGDANNDGMIDFLISGQDANGTPRTDIWFSVNGSYELQDFGIRGLRNSTAEWIDIDEDGDLDVFISGSDQNGSESLIYTNNLIDQRANKSPVAPTNLRLVDLGNGDVRFEWDASLDDYSNHIGYNLRIGRTENGVQVLNPLADLESGYLLVQEQALTSNNYYVTNLNPGVYYWSVQAVDDGYRSSAFAQESDFTLLYEWQKLNLGGIVDRRIGGSDNAILEFFDIDGDSDLDLLYVNAVKSSADPYYAQILINNNNNFKGTNILYDRTLIAVAFGDLNSDGLLDLAFAEKTFSGYQLVVLFPKKSLINVDFSVERTADLFTEIIIDQGLARPNLKIKDLDNNGSNELVISGLTNELSSGIPQLYMIGFNRTGGTTQLDYFTDLSDQIVDLKRAAYDFGDVDNDMDIDYIITGFDDDTGVRSELYINDTPNTTEKNAFYVATNDAFAATIDGTTNMIDFDGDGDLDLVFTGTSRSGADIFELYENRIETGTRSFVNVSIDLDRIRNSKIDLGDFNGDGYADILYSGLSEGTGKVTKLAEFDPLTKRYVESSFDVSNIVDAEVEFGDIDADGDLDFMITGAERGVDNSYIFEIFLNVRNESALFGSATNAVPASITKEKGLKNREQPSYQRAETVLNTVEEFIVNNPPEPPLALNQPSLVDLGDGLFEVTLTWEAGQDDQTPTSGLTYALKVGTEPGLEDIMSSGANENGKREAPGKGNTEHNKRWRLKLREGNYQWAVQSVDASYNGSSFISGSTIIVGEPINLAPSFIEKAFSIDENPISGAQIGTIEAVDPEADAISYSIDSEDVTGATSINSESGELTVAIPSVFDFEVRTQYTLVIRVTDSNSNSITQSFNIQINDVDDASNNPPVIEDQSFSIDENSSNSTIVGTIEGTDADGDAISYTTIASSAENILSVSTTGEITVIDGSQLDFETTTSYSIEVEGTDGNGGFDRAIITINVNDVDESTNRLPVFSDQSFKLNENSEQGTVVGSLIASDPDGDNLVFTLLSGNTGNAFVLTSTGELSVAQSSVLDFETTPSFNLVVKVNDGNGGEAEALITIGLVDIDEIELSSPEKLGVLLYPIPVSKILNLKLPDFKRDEEVSLLDLSGKLLNSYQLKTSEVQIDMSEYEDGIYLLVLRKKLMKVSKVSD